MLLVTFRAILLETFLSGKGAVAERQGQVILRAGYESKRVLYGLKTNC